MPLRSRRPKVLAILAALAIVGIGGCERVGDLDGDGVPDSADAYPLDRACSRPDDGDGSTCHLTRLALHPDAVTVVDASYVLHILVPSEHRVLRWHARRERFLDSLVLDESAAPTTMAYSGDTARVYVGYDDGRVTFFAPPDETTEAEFAAVAAPVDALIAAGPVLMVRHSSEPAIHDYFDANGRRTDGLARPGVGLGDVWHARTNRIFSLTEYRFPQPGRTPLVRLSRESIDPVTGLLGDRHVYDGRWSMPLAISPDGAHVLDGGGLLCDTATFQTCAARAVDPVALVWPEDSGPITLSRDGPDALLERRGVGFDRVEYVRYSGEPIALHQLRRKEFLVLLREPGRWRIARYRPSDDTDGDGVANRFDAFPLDPAAAVDTDRDGAPDAWVRKRGPEDSTGGLVLDVAPESSLCSLPEHLDAGVCDLEARIPAYLPDALDVDEAGVVYLLSSEQEKVFRWSIPDGEHLDPLVIGTIEAPGRPRAHAMSYSSTLDRLHLAFDDDSLRYHDLLDPRVERPYAATAQATRTIESVGPLLLAQWQASHTSSQAPVEIFGADGALRRRQGTWVSPAFLWHEPTDRVYLVSRVVVGGEERPQAAYSFTVDPATGGFDGYGDLVLAYDSNLALPLRVDPTGERLLEGTGRVWNPYPGGVVGELAGPVVDGLWLETGGLVTLREDGAGGTWVEQYGADLRLESRVRYVGVPYRIVGHNGRILVITIDGDSPRFEPYVLDADGDDDGVANELDRFPIDPAASVDDDGDGAPDAWHPGMGPADSTTGLELDAFPGDPKCWLETHARFGFPGICDAARLIPAYVPWLVTSDARGVLYLRSGQHDRIYRYSARERYALPEIPLESGSGAIAYSRAQERLYVAQAPGAITQIDPTDPGLGQQPFADVASTPSPLVPIGDHLLALEGGIGTIYDEAGAVTGPRQTIGSGVPLGDFDPVNERLYFERSYREISAATGTVGDSFSHAAFRAPARVSDDGRMLFEAGGTVRDASTLAVIADLGRRFTDGVFTEAGHLVTIGSETGVVGTVLREWDPDLRLLRTETYTGTPHRIVRSGPYVVVVRVFPDEPPRFSLYAWGDDADGDGVANEADAFPYDAAASLDRDRDGNPDAWNPGRGADDSTEGLALDAFPDDFACQTPSHERNGACDFASVIPEDRNDPFCEIDSRVPDRGRTGALPIGPITDYIPLCDGWIIYGDAETRSVRIDNVVFNRTGARFGLPTAPTDLHLDDATKRLFVGLSGRAELMVVDLIESTTTRLAMPEPIDGIEAGPTGGVFLVGGYSTGDSAQPLYYLDALSTTPAGPWDLPLGAQIAWHEETQTLFDLAYPGYMRMSSFDPVSGPTLLADRLVIGTSGWPAIEISRDGGTMAVAPEGGRFEIYDVDPANPRVTRGTWYPGPIPSGAHGVPSLRFSLDGQWLAALSEVAVVVFDVLDHSEVDRHPGRFGCGSHPPGADFSRGGAILFAWQECAPRELRWRVR
ncbi:MAG: hypothetical protein R3F16_01155 [Myxococcota bacterium]